MERIREIYYMDLYGSLLTKHQQELLQMVIMEDYSLGEIAERLAITRQGVHDGVQRGLAKLQWYEDHLGLYKKHFVQKQKISKIKEILESDRENLSAEVFDLLSELLDV
ncbi:MAG TPA: sigma factor-like helix-turn-helix DNA-binding protein [Clostridia bacterium]|nr:sigma factor-like helix-turn-helix DNA-binding protein [Clostridia bacterium]